MITKETWDGLSDKARWDIKAALRGPDVVGSDPIKYYTSSVIRNEVRKVFRVGGMINADLRLVIAPVPNWKHAPIPRIEQIRRFDGRHFFDHVCTAAEWLQIPRLLISDEDWTAFILAASSLPDLPRITALALKYEAGRKVKEAIDACMKGKGDE